MSTAQNLIDYVPQDVDDHLVWRIHMRQVAAKDRHVRRALYSAAMDDLPFFLAAFCWLIEPRAEVKTIPFIPWPLQIPVAKMMNDTITESQKSDLPVALTVPKSRAQGATYLYIYVLMWRWLKERIFSAGIVTRNEQLVDSKTDSDAILWKVWWGMRQLPAWVLPRGFNERDHRSLSDHTITNPDTGALFQGYSATGDVGRGGRKTVFVMDEIGSEEFSSAGKDYKALSAVSHVSKCIFLISTYGGEHGVFYEAAEDPENPRLIRMDWKENPTQTRNAYVMREGIAVAVDPDEQAAVTDYARTFARQLQRIERRGHQLEGKFRSPWYDSHCLLPGATPQYIARELDMDPRGAVGKVFALDVLDRMREKCCHRPVWQGKAVFDGDTMELRGLIAQPGGPLSLWFTPGLEHSPPPGRFGVGCDIAAGGHSDSASNSVASGVNMLSGEQVMEYVVRGMPPTKFARIVVGLCRWLRNAYLGWELTGPTGSTFGHEVMDVLRYGNIYYRDVDAVGATGKHRTPGWANRTDEDKERLFDALGLAMEEDVYVPRSAEMIVECGEYEWVKGKIVHRASRAASIAPASHGDRCIAAGVANLLLGDRRSTIGLDKTPESMEAEPPYGCFAWRHQQAGLRSRSGNEHEDGEFDLRSVLGIRAETE